MNLYSSPLPLSQLYADDIPLCQNIVFLLLRQSTSWPQADPASDPACSRPGASRLVCKSEWDYKVITNADPTLNPSPNA